MTTEVIGVDGNAYAPFPDPADLAAFVELNAGLDGIRPASRSTGTPSRATWNGSTAGSASTSRSWSGTPRCGSRAFGLGGRSGRRARDRADDGHAPRRGWRPARGASPPGSTTRLGRSPRPTSWRRWRTRRHASAASTTPTSGTRWATGSSTRSARRSRSADGARRPPTSRTSTIARPSPVARTRCSRSIDDARAEGLDVTFDAYPYEWASTRLLITIPTWVQAGGPGPTKERLADRAVRARIRRELEARGVLYAGAGGIADIRLGYFGRPEHARWEGRTLGEIGRETGEDLVELLCDLLLAEGLRLNQVTPGAAHGRDPPLPTATRSRWSGRIRPSSVRSRARGPTAPSRGSSASSSATRASWASRRRSRR